MAETPFCIGHQEVKKDIEKIEEKQNLRPCGVHESRLNFLEEAIKDQWSQINKLKIPIYMGAGAAGGLSLLGSIIGSWIKGH